MKIYCSCCDKVQSVRIDNCRDAKTNEPFQDIVCAECHLVIASGTDIAEQEPVACVQDLDEVKRKHLVYEKGMDWKDPLYTTPPQRKPLTQQDLARLWMQTNDYYKFARAIEAAHGIGENT